MALLTNEQATQIYNSALTKRVRIDIDNTFYTYRLTGEYLGFEYQVDSLIDGIVLDENSTPAEIETEFIAALETRTFRGTDPVGTVTSF